MLARRTFNFLVALLFLLTSFVSFNAKEAKAAIYPNNNGQWLVAGSRNNPNAAIQYAQKLSRQHSGVHVFLSSNGWYAITLGWINKSVGNGIKNQLINSGSIPNDSYFHNGQRFIELIWSTSGMRGRSRNTILNATAYYSQPTRPNPNPIDASHNGPAYVTGLKSGPDSYLSLRTGPSTRNNEITRMPANTNLTILGKQNGWYNIRLSNGQTGWAYGKYITLGNYIAPPPVQPREPELVIDNTDNGKLFEVTGISVDDFLSVRKGPAIKHAAIAQLRNRTKFEVTGKADGWYRIKYNESLEGWVSGKYVKQSEIPLIGPDETSPEIPKTPKEPEVSENDINDDVTIPIVDGKRVALILGNSAYEHTTELANPKNDADKISAQLKKLGFQVIVGLDGSKTSMENSIREFVKILDDADVALFFYAGHAMQVNGSNFLIPTDAKLEDSTAIDFETINLQSILNFIDKPGRISIALLDACRDNPLSRRFARKLGTTRSAFIGRGLASPTTTGNLLIGFATAPGEVALDGDGENSPFTTALIKHMATPDLEVEAMLKKVRSEVFTLTNEQQSPWVNSGLRKEFYFAKSEAQ